MDNEQPHQELVKCVVVGDTAVGKTRLVCARACDKQLTLSQLMNTHIPTVWAIDQYRIYKEVLERSWEVVDRVNVSLRLWDTFGDHDKDRRFAYGRSDVVLLCFSISNPSSLRNCKLMWYPEIRKFCPNTPIILVGCKNDLRYMYMDEQYLSHFKDKSPFMRPVKECDILTPDQGRSVAKDIGAPYYETSVFSDYGVTEVFENVIRAALCERRRQRFWMTNLKKVQKPLLQIPFCPPKPMLPEIEIDESTMPFDMLEMFQGQAHTDVIFLAGNTGFPGHKIVLCAASPALHKLLTTDLFESASITTRCSSDSSVVSSVSDACFGNFNPDTEQLLVPEDAMSVGNTTPAKHQRSSSCHHRAPLQAEQGTTAGKEGVYREINHPAFKSIQVKQYEGLDHRGKASRSIQTIVILNRTITPNAMQHCLRFLYTGQLDQPIPPYDLQEVQKAALLMEMPVLHDYVQNIMDNEEFVNQELCRNYLRSTYKQLAELGCENGLFSDVLFQLDDGMCAAHRALLMARCDMMSAMFGGDFRESSAKVVHFPGVKRDVFRKLLFYLYSDNCPPVKPVDCLDIIELGNKLCLPRLVALVENEIVCEFSRLILGGADVSEEVLQLIEPAFIHNGFQLADWCMTHIAINYNDICKHSLKLLKNLHPENQAYLNRHRWPPVWFLKEQDYYQRCLSEQRKDETPLKVLKRTRKSFCLCFKSKAKRKSEKITTHGM